MAALLAAPDPETWIGRRDRALLLLAVQTGLRASELLGLRCEDITLGPSAFVHCLGKGRKLRNTPLRKNSVAVLRVWLAERRGQPSDPAFPTITGIRLSHDEFQYLLNKHVALRRGSPHPERFVSEDAERVAGREMARGEGERLGDLARTVSLSIPCVVGPYVGVNCKLTLLRSDIRRSPSTKPGYTRGGQDDPRFITSYGPIEIDRHQFGPR